MKGRFILGLFAILVATGCRAAAPPADTPSSGTAATRNANQLVEQGRAYAEMGDGLRAQQYFAAGLKAGADESVVFPLLLRACILQKNYRLAVDYAEASLARHPNDARLRFLTGALHGTLGDTARSREHLELAAKELPTDAEVQFAVGVFFRDDAADRPAADPYFRRYLALAPRGAHVDEAKASLMERITRPAPEEASQ